MTPTPPPTAMRRDPVEHMTTIGDELIDISVRLSLAAPATPTAHGDAAAALVRVLGGAMECLLALQQTPVPPAWKGKMGHLDVAAEGTAEETWRDAIEHLSAARLVLVSATATLRRSRTLLSKIGIRR